MLRARTGSALARAFKRFARCAVVGFALAGLAACGGGGGGGSSTPAEKTPTTPGPAPTPTPPEIPITPGGGTMAEAIDITGMETVEGELDSADDADYYELRSDEDIDVTFWTDTADVEFQILDSEGNVLVTSTSSGAGAGSSSGPAPAALGRGFEIARFLLRGGQKIILRVSPKKGRSGCRSRIDTKEIL